MLMPHFFKFHLLRFIIHFFLNSIFMQYAYSIYCKGYKRKEY